MIITLRTKGFLIFIFFINTAVYESASVTPAYLNFGRHLHLNGSFYSNCMPKDVNILPLDNGRYTQEVCKLPNLYLRVQHSIHQAYRRNAHSYNLRKRPADNYKVGDKVWKRNYVLSSGLEYFFSKLAPKFVLCTVRSKVSCLVNQLTDEAGRDLGRWHVKDLKPYRENASTD